MSRTSGITGKTLNNSFALGREIHENRVIGLITEHPVLRFIRPVCIRQYRTADN